MGKKNPKRLIFADLFRSQKCRDASFYGLPVVITENCKNFQFSTDYGKLEFFKKVVMRNFTKKSAKSENMISDGVEFSRSIVF